MTPDFTRQQQLCWFRGLPKAGYFIMGVEYEGKPIGAVGLKNFLRSSAEYFGYIGEREYWGKGLGREIIDFAVANSRERGLQKIRIKVRSDNARAIHLYHRSGFVMVGSEAGVLQMCKELSEQSRDSYPSAFDPYV